MIMTKTEFLKELKWQLKFKLPKNETADILSDYEEYFQTGLSEGKSEEEICLSFGEPRQIALDLVVNFPSALLREALAFIKETLPYILLILSVIPLFYKVDSGNSSGMFVSVYVLILPAIMMFCLFDKVGSEPYKKKFWIIMSFFCEAVLIAFIMWASTVTLGSVTSYTLIPKSIVQIQKLLSLLLAAIALVAWLYAVELSKKHGKKMFSLFFLQAGIFAMGICCYHYLHLRTETYMLGNTFHLFYPLAFGLFAAIMAYIILKGDLFIMQKKAPFKNATNTKRAFALLLVISSLSLCTGQMLSHSSFHIYWGFAYIIVMPPIIVYLMREKNSDNGYTEDNGVPKKKVNLLIGLSASQLIIITFISVMMFRLSDFSKPVFFNIPPENLGLLFTYIFLLGGIFNICIWLYELVNYKLFKNTILQFSFLNAGILAMLYRFNSLIGSLSDPNAILGSIIETHYLMFAGLGLAVLSSIPYIVNRIHKGVR